ncbi:hypothetical protein IVB69_00025 [Flavobacterium sp. J49]|uniref:hypothetical protein n=1 Tax=Flavobacterium sp. J49 TaxID=2718534 RepID=UPI001592E64E|nr:hypothetical protein [Flavobacterium sp. J49]MBF6639854.1 hypothetical protein [Flavobacterium sp. J49]NIC01095.1 hypothetical protein [Flavobacterium sp. J49]
MKLTIYILILFTFFSCKSSKVDLELTQINTKVEYYQNGKIKTVVNTDSLTGLRIGFWNEFYENGQLKESGNYKLDSYKQCCVAGLCDEFYSYKFGEWSYYHLNGKLKAKGIYKIGKKIRNTNCEGGAEINFGFITENWKFYNEEGIEIKPNTSDITEIEKSSYTTQWDLLKN